jgi:hypothetical protein
MASGQRVLVLSQARSVSGEAAGLQLQSIDLSAGSVQPGGLKLRGSALVAPPFLDRQHTGLIVSAGSGGLQPQSTVAGFRVAPLAPRAGADSHVASGQSTWAVGITEDRLTLSNLLVIAKNQRDDRGLRHGMLATRPWPPEGLPDRVQAEGREVLLPISPRHVLPLGPMEYLVIGTASERAPVSVVWASLSTGEVGQPMILPSNSGGTGFGELRGAALDSDHGILWILLSEFVLDWEGVAPTSWLHAIDTRALVPLGSALELPGMGTADGDSLVIDASGQCWVATRVMGAEYAYITRVGYSSGAGQTEKKQQWPLVGVRERAGVVPAPSGNDVAVYIDQRVEYWPGGLRKGPGSMFAEPVAALSWADERLIVAEGNRLHSITLPDCKPVKTVALQSGWPVDFVIVPPDALPAPDADGDGLVDEAELKHQSQPDNPDTDGDGIPDGRDPHPTAVSPRLEVPAEIVIPYTAVGRELRALRIESPGAPQALWRIEFDSEALPWLRVYPTGDRGSGYSYLAVDPGRFRPSDVLEGTITVSLVGRSKGNRPGYRSANSPSKVHVRVAPPKTPLPAILWLLSGSRTGDPSDFAGLRALLAEAPYFFSHVTRSGPVSEPLSPFSIIVLDTQSVEAGVLTQKALLDYLNGGGAVLFLGGQPTGESSRDLSSWFRPLDFQLDMQQEVSGRFSSATSPELLRHWKEFSIVGGCQIVDRRTGGDTVRIRNGDAGRLVFAARPHGYGRIALLAAPTPLQGDRLSRRKNCLFALDLFYWLQRAGFDVSDRDGDGILDDQEVQLGAVGDVRELGGSDWLNPDSDGDGIPDGMEDSNRNGVLDPGETDPSRSDSDGDGTDDGADATPAG